MQLTDACICCAINYSFLFVVEGILYQRREVVEYITFETTCVADQVPVITSVMDKVISIEERLDSMLTLVGTLLFDVEAQCFLSPSSRRSCPHTPSSGLRRI